MQTHVPPNRGKDGFTKPIPDILAIIKDTYTEFRPAERQVADVVLADVSFAVDASNAAIAQRANVSEPTVTRFCRSIGCEGVRDFKLKLAQSVVVGRLYLDQVSPEQPAGDGSPLMKVVFSEARNAISVVERSIDPASVLEAADLVANAHQVVVLGLGGSSTSLAHETQNRLFRYGIVTVSHSDPYILKMTAATLKPNDLVIAISGTGRTREVIEVVELAKHYRAKAIGITAPDSELAALCDVKLTVEVPEYPDTLKPTASRYAFLLIIDLLSTAVGYRLDPSSRETLRRIKYTVLAHREGKTLEPLGD
ncbi:DNA-binding MurR/RpiR family transcriptional regulator [Devosia subaequoris]|uniref:DNA-binding MurR/RpiR family transcriptional regulator n=1 Tax=Devosia subaequoris TaxID=395930 RepID=A0A7W6IR36_9HYPH|nr:MurR/RpiR family transcriptional regulator [Devosia subaequoris]MBB4053646.1 DNA-binding MurR/RpiR family transcriptional regulator [Devosia subaequoris]MCP1211220.1 MurR/RpiR family transcriptional regulator [Devosia subaequoris]